MCTKLMKSRISHTTHLKSTAEMAQKREKFIPKGGGQNPEKNISLAVAATEAWGPTLVLRARLGHMPSPGPQVERIRSGDVSLEKPLLQRGNGDKLPWTGLSLCGIFLNSCILSACALLWVWSRDLCFSERSK